MKNYSFVLIMCVCLLLPVLASAEGGNDPTQEGWFFDGTQGGSASVSLGDKMVLKVWAYENQVFLTYWDYSTDNKSGCSTMEFSVDGYSQHWGTGCKNWETFNGASIYGSRLEYPLNQEALHQLMAGNKMTLWIDGRKWKISLRGSSRSIREMLASE